jgi:hypothetical protein
MRASIPSRPVQGVGVTTADESTARILEIDAAGLGLRIDPVRQRLELRGPGTQRFTITPRIAPATLAAAFGDPSALRTTAVGEIKGRAGAAQRIEIQTTAPGRPGFRWTIEAPADSAGVCLALAIENRTAARLALGALEFVATGTGAIAFPPVTRSLGLQHPSAGPARAGRRVLQRIRLRARRRLRDELLLLGASDGACLLAAHTTALRAATRIECDLRGAALRSLSLCTDAAPHPLDPGEIFESERAWLALGDDGSALLAEWARRTGLEMEARVPARAYVGWSPRTRSRGNPPDGEAIDPQLAVLRTLPGPRVVELDADIAPATPNATRLAPVASRIREAGCLPAVALAPFLAARGSRLLHEVPEAALRDARGRGIRVSTGGSEPARFALDPTHPAVRDALCETFERLRTLGFGAFRLSQLSAGVREGAHFDATLGPVEAYREALGAIRRGAGDDALLIGCDAPVTASVGLLDALRLESPAPTPGWRSRLDRLWRRPPDSAERSAGEVVAKAFTTQRLWLLDPGPVPLGGPAIPRAEVQTLLSLAALGAGSIRIDGDLTGLEAPRLDWLRCTLPPLARHARAQVPWTCSGTRVLLTPLFGERLAVVAWNPGDRSREIGLDLAELGCRGPHHVYDFWEDCYVGVIDRRIPPRRVAPHGCRVLGLTPTSDRPQVVGSNLHIGMGTLEVASLRATREPGLRLSLRLPGAHAGAVWIAAGGARDAHCVAVDFEDSATIRVAG